MNKLLTLVVLTLILAATLLVSGCHQAEAAERGGAAPRIGSDCIIQFRRDALGTASPIPVPPMTSAINGSETTISGTIITVNSEWIAVQASRGQVWVPKSSILLVQIGNK